VLKEILADILYFKVENGFSAGYQEIFIRYFHDTNVVHLGEGNGNWKGEPGWEIEFMYYSQRRVTLTIAE
jgi:hypothetical protein